MEVVDQLLSESQFLTFANFVPSNYSLAHKGIFLSFATNGCEERINVFSSVHILLFY